MGWTIRPAIAADLPGVAAVFRRASLSNEDDRPNLLSRPDLLEFEGAAVLESSTRVADDDGVIVGFVTVLDGEDAAELEDLFVDPDRRREGIARELVAREVQRARTAGLSRIEVSANRHALAFYESAGFVTVGEADTLFGPVPRMHLDLAVTVLVVQHAEKERVPGDPGLSDVGAAQADATAAFLAGKDRPVGVWSSSMRRGRETADAIGRALGLEPERDDRLRERMNWEGGDQSLDAFLAEWARASEDRTYRPLGGDSSTAAAARFLDALGDLTAPAPVGATVVVVAHGGVTTDALRTLLGDGELQRRAPGLIEAGVPPAAITTLRGAGDRWTVVAVADATHLDPRS